MTKDEALDLALEALKYIHEGANNQGPHTGISWRCVAVKAEPAIKAIKQALALDKMAENARELGLDYEPVGLIDRLTHPEQHYEFTDPKKANAVLMSLCQEAADALAAPVQEPVVFYRCNGCGHAYEQVHPTSCDCMEAGGFDRVEYFTTPPAQPAVPDAMTSADIQEHIEYVAGWNDCRAEMLKGMKP
jgi:hypothetical protein